jgi:carbonic anhydrase
MNIKTIFQSLLMVIVTISTAYAEPHWGYDEQTNWGAIAEPNLPIPKRYPYAECGIGEKQSPVDIKSPITTSALNSIRTIYNPTPLSIINNGHTIMVPMPLDSKNRLRVGIEKYSLLQFHFHAPSEHKLNGHTFPMEIHFVNATDNGKLAVVGVLVKQGIMNTELQKILDNAPLDEGTNTLPETIRPAQLLPSNKNRFYNYAGSLTTPPCTEGVDWHILRQPIEASAAQIAQFKALYTNNARTTQNANGRIVQLSKTAPY